MLGGINDPRVPDAAMTPVANPRSYLCLNISGTAIRAIADAVATLEPEAAANIEHAPTLAIASPPGRRDKHTLMALKSP